MVQWTAVVQSGGPAAVVYLVYEEGWIGSSVKQNHFLGDVFSLKSELPWLV